MKLKFNEVDHKYWESNIMEKGHPKFTISTDYQNMYLKPENRSKKPEYRLNIWDGELLFDSSSFDSFYKAKEYANFIQLNP